MPEDGYIGVLTAAIETSANTGDTVRVRLYIKLGKRVGATVLQLGYRRIHASLSRQSLKISEKVVRRLMKQECLVVTARKRRRYGSYMGEITMSPASNKRGHFCFTQRGHLHVSLTILKMGLAGHRIAAYSSPPRNCIATSATQHSVDGELAARIEQVPKKFRWGLQEKKPQDKIDVFPGSAKKRRTRSLKT